MADKEDIRPIYLELQGYLAQAPNSEKQSTITSQAVWVQYNNRISELEEATEDDYSRFIIEPSEWGMGGQMKTKITGIKTDSYRQKLGGLIGRLHGEYFSDE